MRWHADRRGKLLRQSGVRDLSDTDCARKQNSIWIQTQTVLQNRKWHTPCSMPDQRQHSIWTHVLPAELSTPSALGEPGTIVIVRRPVGAVLDSLRSLD